MNALLPLFFSLSLAAQPALNYTNPLTTVRVDKSEDCYSFRSCVVLRGTHDVTDRCTTAWVVKATELPQLQERMTAECGKHLSEKPAELCRQQILLDLNELVSSSPSSVRTYTPNEGSYTGWVLTFFQELPIK